MNILSLLGTKASMAVIGVLMVGLTWGGMKFRIWRLEGQLVKAQTLTAQVKQQRQACKADLGELRLSFFRQNERIDRMKDDATAITLTADLAALQIIASPIELEKAVQTPPGHEEMNRFVADLFREGN